MIHHWVWLQSGHSRKAWTQWGIARVICLDSNVNTVTAKCAAASQRERRSWQLHRKHAPLCVSAVCSDNCFCFLHFGPQCISAAWLIKEKLQHQVCVDKILKLICAFFQSFCKWRILDGRTDCCFYRACIINGSFGWMTHWCEWI